MRKIQKMLRVDDAGAANLAAIAEALDVSENVALCRLLPDAQRLGALLEYHRAVNNRGGVGLLDTLWGALDLQIRDYISRVCQSRYQAELHPLHLRGQVFETFTQFAKALRGEDGYGFEKIRCTCGQAAEADYVMITRGAK